MSAGSVSVAADGTVTKSGLAGAIYDARVTMLAAAGAPAIPSGPDGFKLKNGFALDANALSSAIYPEIAGTIVITPGCIMIYPLPVSPTGWFVCAGASISRTTYADLFAVIGTTFGAVDAAHFNLPTIPDVIPGMPYIIKT